MQKDIRKDYLVLERKKNNRDVVESRYHKKYFFNKDTNYQSKVPLEIANELLTTGEYTVVPEVVEVEKVVEVQKVRYRRPKKKKGSKK